MLGRRSGDGVVAPQSRPELGHEGQSRRARQKTHAVGQLAVRRPGDITIVSLHWGSNCGYSVSLDQTAFAHRLIDAGTDIVYGHSSHHPRPIEVYRDRLILYGCGDLINDYEGIAGEEGFRPDLRALYFPVLRSTGELEALTVSVMRSRRFRLEPADREDAVWLAEVLEGSSQRFGTRVKVDAVEDSTLRVAWPTAAQTPAEARA